MELSIKTVAMLVLMIMIVALVYAAFQGWFTEIVDQFVSSITYPTI